MDMTEMLAEFMLQVLHKMISNGCEQAQAQGITLEEWNEQEGVDLWGQVEDLSNRINTMTSKEGKEIFAEKFEQIIELIENCGK